MVHVHVSRDEGDKAQNRIKEDIGSSFLAILKDSSIIESRNQERWNNKLRVFQPFYVVGIGTQVDPLHVKADPLKSVSQEQVVQPYRPGADPPYL